MTERIAIITNVFDSAGVPGVDALVDEGCLTLCHARAFSDPAARAAFEANGPNRVASSAETPAALAREAIDRFGRVDVAVSNDFAQVLQGPFVDRSAEDYRALLENFTVSSFCLAAAVVPKMIEQRSGRIIFMTSGAALKPSPGLILYSAARAATNQMVRSLAVEVAPYGISVNAIAPAFFVSSFFPGGADDPDLARLVKEHVPMQRHGRPEELAALIGVLASGRADYISGQIIAFSGAS
ncbi:MAG TPA: SDR family oxidoreductase [Steroidobacteraceae bacterium]|nr:SDR family oxidoreductase [Steroidobacteraceae bacterium]